MHSHTPPPPLHSKALVLTAFMVGEKQTNSMQRARREGGRRVCLRNLQLSFYLLFFLNSDIPLCHSKKNCKVLHLKIITFEY